MIDFLYYCRCCWRAYRSAAPISYFALTRYGIPNTVVIVGRGREAWRVSQFATESFQRLN